VEGKPGERTKHERFEGNEGTDGGGKNGFLKGGRAPGENRLNTKTASHISTRNSKGGKHSGGQQRGRRK